MRSVVDGGQESHLDFKFERSDQVHRQHDRIHRYDAKGVELAVLSADRDILARQKRMCAELVTGFIVVVLVGIVIENPACVLSAARLVDETTDLVVLSCPKPPYPAVVPILLPEDRVDMSLEIERCDEIISVM